MGDMETEHPVESVRCESVVPGGSSRCDLVTDHGGYHFHFDPNAEVTVPGETKHGRYEGGKRVGCGWNDAGAVWLGFCSVEVAHKATRSMEMGDMETEQTADYEARILALQAEVDDLKDYLAKVVEERNTLRQRRAEDEWLVEHAVEHTDGPQEVHDA